MTRFTTWYGYFGPSANVRDVSADAPDPDALAAMIAALPRRAAPSAEIVTLPIARDPAGRRLRFIPVADLTAGD